MMFLIKTIQNYISYPANASNAIINGITGFGDVFKSAWDNSTSSNALKSLAVSGLSSGITTGLTNKLNLDIQNSLTDALKESALSTSTSTLLQSTINNDSFSEALKNQAINTVVGTLANLTAKEIGSNYHSGKINKGEQLFLHALLGATANELTGNDALSGAASGVVGEITAELIGEKYYNGKNNLTDSQKKDIIEISGLASGLTSIIITKSEGRDIRNITDNAYSGQRIGKNASQNNYLLPEEKGNLVEKLENCNGDNNCKNKVQNIYKKISDERDEEFEKEMIECAMGRCSKFNEIHYDLRMKLTEEGNEYYKNYKDEFKKLKESESVFHTFQQDKNGNVINVINGAEQGYTKYVHPVYGYEVVLDNNGNIVTNPLNIGTYNFYNPYNGVNNSLIEDKGDIYNKNFGNHKKYDVDPYFLNGNSNNDPSSIADRYLRLFYSINKKINEK